MEIVKTDEHQVESSMNELIPIFKEKIGGDEVDAINARDLWKYLEVKRLYPNWIGDQIGRLRLRKHRDYEVFNKNVKNSKGGRPMTEYHFPIDITKHVAMVSKTRKGWEVREYFIQFEKTTRSELLTDPIIQLRMNQIFMNHQIETLRSEMSEVKRGAERTDVALLEEPQKTVQETKSDKAIRAEINVLVRKYAGRNARAIDNVWNFLYEVFQNRYIVNLKEMAKEENDTMLDVVEKSGCLDKLYDMAKEIFN